MNKKRGLGKGLSDLGLGALLGDLRTSPAPVMDFQKAMATAAFSAIDESLPVDGQLKNIPIDALQPGKYQPRKMIAPEALEELANSIRTQGVIQPIIVRLIDNDQYEIIAGERRWRAAKLAKLDFIPAIIRDITDESAMVMALIENIQRRDLNVIEEAMAFNRLMNEFNLTHNQVAEAVGKSRVAVTNILRLLKLNFDVRMMVENGQLEMGHARALVTLAEEQQTIAASLVVARRLSVRETEDLVRKLSEHRHEHIAEFSERKAMLRSLQERITQQLGAKVSVTQNEKGRGKLIIQYKNEKELETILARIQISPAH